MGSRAKYTLALIGSAAVSLSLYIFCGNSYSPSATRPVPTTSISAEKKPRVFHRSHCSHVARCGARLLGSCSIGSTYAVDHVSLWIGGIESSRYLTDTAFDGIPQDNTCEDTDSRNDQREHYVDLRRLQ